ncbi:Aldo/keto reductase [Alteribacillus persepolensis]|uniref:Aldo/keto reductase n=1 Tax=Alteribacillus persepolensis TaxID=568899 RepID=A0A1G8IPF9_9BACI|nr:aldo/keto reductase [Alteribacillus persepolensis]SDI20691.1 Aldo/keto reductase [Alteribacillus persepolensis]
MKQDEQHIREHVKQKTVTLPDGTTLPCIGQGTWHMGEKQADRKQEVHALQFGIDLGMTVLDTAEMYGDGEAERVAGEAIKGRRDEVFLVSKVYPHHAGREHLQAACENSLKRLETDTIDLYLLHWRGSVPLAETIEEMEKLKAAGKIKRWGVSNFDTADMNELISKKDGHYCMTNQVLYHLGSRGIEYDLLPWQKQQNMPVMAYCPLAQGGALRQQLLTNPTINEIADCYEASPLQVALAWTVVSNHVISIPKASNQRHVKENARAASISLTKEECLQLDQAFPPPTRKMPLDIV